jgi:hypothetical protein
MDRKVNVEVVEKDERFCGEPTGNRVWTVMETGPFSRIFRGCPLGRGYSKVAALEDFCYRANADDRVLKLTTQELVIVSEKKQ